MDPKHQFAAQYVLSRAAAERREREILASSSLGITDRRLPLSQKILKNRVASKSHRIVEKYNVAPRPMTERCSNVKSLRCTGAGLGVLGGSQSGGPQNLQPPMCPSPSAHSDSSSGNGRLSSAGSEPGTLRYLFYVYYLQTNAHQISRYNRYIILSHLLEHSL